MGGLSVHAIGHHSCRRLSERKVPTSYGDVGVSAELISAIRNLVCPECGGPMGGRLKEFQCRGKCGVDWRSVWEHAIARVTGPCSPRSLSQTA